jgi:drug/metabolite transporter (DMT)-like permease
MKKLILLWLVMTLLNTFFQICIKSAATKMGALGFGMDWITRAASVPWMWAALLSELASFMVWMEILSRQNVSKAAPFSAICYVLILLVSWGVFKEQIMPLQVVGTLLVLAGIWLIGTASNTKPSIKGTT